MKEYNAKIIVNNDELKIAFECDKEKNIGCKGNENCRECNYTTDTRYIKARQRQNKKDISDKELIINLENEIDYYRNKIEQLEKVHKEEREYIRNHCDEEEYDYDIEQIISTTEYADGKPVKIITETKYKYD